MKYLCIIAILASSCTSQTKHIPEAVFTDSVLKRISVGFQSCLDQDKVTDKVITIHFRKHYDTTSISLANSYPDLDMAKIRGYTILSGYTVYFLGETSLLDYYKITGNIEAPTDLIKSNQRNGKLDNLTIKEPKTWFIKFYKQNLLRYSPTNEINQFVPDITSRSL